MRRASFECWQLGPRRACPVATSDLGRDPERSARRCCGAIARVRIGSTEPHCDRGRHARCRLSPAANIFPPRHWRLSGCVVLPKGVRMHSYHHNRKFSRLFFALFKKARPFYERYQRYASGRAIAKCCSDPVPNELRARFSSTFSSWMRSSRSLLRALARRGPRAEFSVVRLYTYRDSSQARSRTESYTYRDKVKKENLTNQ